MRHVPTLFSFAPTGVQRIAILRILCGHLSAYLPFFSLFRGEVSNYIAPEADLLETYPRRPVEGLFPHVGDAAAVERSLDLDEGVVTDKFPDKKLAVLSCGELTEVF